MKRDDMPGALEIPTTIKDTLQKKGEILFPEFEIQGSMKPAFRDVGSEFLNSDKYRLAKIERGRIAS